MIATAQPTITSFTPMSGLVGSNVTITGTNFNVTASDNIVYFGAVKASVNSASATSLNVTVPVGATYTPISVTNLTTGLTAYSAKPFTMTFNSIQKIDATTFLAKVDFAAGPGTQSVVIGDLNGDGKPDVVSANYPNTISIFRNTSTSGSINAASFAPKIDISSGENPMDAAIGDVDGDGKLDLVIVNFQDRTFSVFRNTSNSDSITFAPRVNVATGRGVYSVAIGDIDCDGKPDIITSNYEDNTFSVFRNTSTIGSISTGSFASAVDFATGTNPMGVAIGDLDEDGKADIIISTFTNLLSVYRNTSSPGSISVAGKIDYVTGSGQSSVAVSDLDSDGKLDIIKTNNAEHTFSVFRNTSSFGSVSFASKVDFATEQNPRTVALGDVDGDGKPDVAIHTIGGPAVSMFRNTSTAGSISFTDRVNSAATFGPQCILVGDIDGDNRPDILTANYSGSLSVFRNSITVFTAIPFSPVPVLPVHNAINQSTNISLHWNRTTEAKAYHLQMGTDSTFAAGMIINDSTMTDTVKSVTGLSISTRYFWRVAAWNTIGSGSYSSVRTFTTIVPAPTSVAAIPDDRRINLQWTASVAPNILRYKIYRGISSPASIFIDSTSSIQFIDSNLTNGTRYFYLITAVNTLSIEGPLSSEVNTIPFTTPLLAAPAEGTLNLPTTLTLLWHPSPGATAYHVQCGTDPAFTSGIVINDSTVTDTSRSISGLTVSTKYYWRVAARENDVTSLFSSARTLFTIVPAPTSLTTNPGNQRMVLSWSASVAPNILRYRIYRSTSSPASVLIDSTSSTQYVDSNLTNGTRYYYRMRAVNNLFIEGPFSNEIQSTPLNASPHVNILQDIFQPNSLTVSSPITFSSAGSYDSDGTVDSMFWFVNGELFGRQQQFTHIFGQGTNKVMLVVQDNQGARDTSRATVNRSKFKFFLNGGVYAGPSLLGSNILYVIGTGDAVYRLDASGNDLYSLQVGGEVKSSSSIAYDTTVYIASTDKNLYAFSKFGASLWAALPLGGLMVSTPAVDSVTNRIYVGVSNKNFFAVERLTGKVAWNYFVDAPILGSATITLDRKLIFATVKGTVYGFDLNDPSSSPTPAWQLSLFDSINGSPAIDGDGYVYYGTSSGKIVKLSFPRNQLPSIVWQTQLGGSIVGSPVIDGYSNLYMGSTDKRLYAIKTQNGNIKWSFESGSPILSTPAISNAGLIYVGDHGGRVTALDTNSVRQWYYQDSTGIDAPLLYQRGVLYVGTVGGRLIAFYDNADSSVSMALNSTTLGKTNDAFRLPVWGTFQGNNQRTGLPVGKIITNIQESDDIVPLMFQLSQNYPNPFNPSTIIRYALPTSAHVKLSVYDLLGREIATLVNEEQSAGWKEVNWNAKGVSSGIYFAKLQSGDKVQLKKMMMIK